MAKLIPHLILMAAVDSSPGSTATAPPDHPPEPRAPTERTFLAEPTPSRAIVLDTRCGAVSRDGHRCKLTAGHASVTVEGVKTPRGTIRHRADDGRTFATEVEHESDGAIDEVLAFVEDIIERHGERAVRRIGGWLKRRLGGLL